MSDPPKRPPKRPSVPRGRFNRLGKLVGMTARVGRDAMSARVKRMLGGEGDPKLQAARRVLDTLGEMKGAALKLGQTLSLGANQLPPEVRQVVAGLFSQAPAVGYDEIAAQIQRELGHRPEDIFASFSHEPFAAASLGQVHRAELVQDGERHVVAVKVQYPGVEEALDQDLRNAASVVRAFGLGRLLDGRAYMNEVRAEITAELDYRRELELLESFRGFLAPWPDLVVPAAYPQVSSARVLVLQLVEGPTLHEYSTTADAHPADERFRVATQLLRAVWGPFARHHVIHGDTHPGNFIVCPDGRLGVLDYGSIKFLSEHFWTCYHRLITKGLQAQGRTADIDFVSTLREGGFTITVSDARAQQLISDIAHIVERPLREPYDFGADSTVEDLRALGLKRATELVRIRPPPEAILFYRAAAGLTYNLRHLKAAGDFRPVFREIFEL